MKTKNVYTVTRKVFFFECLTIFLLMAGIWADEVFDIPFLLFNAQPTPVNWQEAIFESLLILGVGTLAITHNRRTLLKVNKIAEIIPVCASCHKIYDTDEFWNILKKGADQYCESKFVDGICMDCLQEYSPEVYALRMEELAKRKNDESDTEDIITNNR